MDEGTTDTEIAIKKYNDETFVVFKPTNSKKDDLYNTRFQTESVPWIKDDPCAKIHSGFLEKIQSVSEKLDDLLSDSETVIYTGFSQGGAMAQLAAHRYKSLHPECNIHCYAYASPRIGNKNFTIKCNTIVKTNFRIYYGDDPVPCLPPKFLLYTDAGNGVWITSEGKLVQRDRPWWRNIYILSRWNTGWGAEPMKDHSSQLLLNKLRSL